MKFQKFTLYKEWRKLSALNMLAMPISSFLEWIHVVEQGIELVLKNTMIKHLFTINSNYWF
jgi:hypothetical protein